jgi:hypothetical protein
MNSPRPHRTAGPSIFAVGREHTTLPDGPANADALEAIGDRGITAALEHAELAESPVTHRTVVISICFDPADDGNLRHKFSYERTG